MSRRLSLLICGGGVMQLPAIAIARDEGFLVVVADGNADCPGRDRADVFEHVDLRDREGMTAVARKHRVDGVFTAGTDFSTTVAWVAEQCGLPGIPYEVAERASDKQLMRECLSLASVPVPPFAIFASKKQLFGGEAVPVPAVVKPVDNMGARGVVRIAEIDELPAALEHADRFARDGRVIVEGFIAGVEYSIDAVVVDGNISICGVADRHIAFPPYFVEVGHTIPADLDGSAREVLERVFGDAVRAIGIRNGAAKGDVFLVAPGTVLPWQPEEPPASNRVIIGEIAARLSGGYMSGWTYPYATGVEPTRIAMRIALGLEPGAASPSRAWTSAERAIISIPGTLRSDIDVSQIADTEEVRDVFLSVASGDDVGLPRNNVEKCGNLIVSAPTRREAVGAADAALRQVRIELVIGKDETDLFLFGPVAPRTTAWHADADRYGPNKPNPDRRREVECAQSVGECLQRGAPSVSASGAVSDQAPTARCSVLLKNLGSRVPPADLRTHNAVGEGFDHQRNTRSRAIDRVQAREELESLSIVGPDVALFSALAELALLRGGLQGLDYLIDTVGEGKLWNNLKRKLVEWY